MTLKSRQKRIIVSAALVLVSILLIVFPKKSAFGAYFGIVNCLEIIVPSLFPFMVVTIFLTESGYYKQIFSIPSALLSKITGVDKNLCSLFFLGLIGGYQSAAKSVTILCKNNVILPECASILLCFCTNAGPAFLISAVGTGMYLSSSVGVILFIASIMSSFSLMLFYAPKLNKINDLTNYKINKGLVSCFVNSVKEACKTITFMSSFIVLFSVAIYMVPEFSENFYYLKSLLYGLLEVTSGVRASSAEISLTSILATAAICAFGGFCIILQIAAICSEANIKIFPFIFSRIIHTILSVLYTFLLLLTIPIEIKETFVSNASTAMPSVYSAPLPALMLLICCITFPIYLTRQKNF